MLTKRELKLRLKTLTPGTVVYVYIHGLLAVRKGKAYSVSLTNTDSLIGFHQTNKKAEDGIVRNPVLAFQIAKYYAENMGWGDLINKRACESFHHDFFLKKTFGVGVIENFP